MPPRPQPRAETGPASLLCSSRGEKGTAGGQKSWVRSMPWVASWGSVSPSEVHQAVPVACPALAHVLEASKAFHTHAHYGKTESGDNPENFPST